MQMVEKGFSLQNVKIINPYVLTRKMTYPNYMIIDLNN